MKRKLRAVAGAIRPGFPEFTGAAVSARTSWSMPSSRVKISSAKVRPPSTATSSDRARARRNDRDPGCDLCSNHRATPAARKPQAVFTFMVARPGSKLLRTAMSRNQPTITAAPTHATTTDPIRANQLRNKK